MTKEFFEERCEKAQNTLDLLKVRYNKPEQLALLQDIQNVITDNHVIVGTFENIEKLYNIKIFKTENKAI